MLPSYCFLPPLPAHTTAFPEKQHPSGCSPPNSHLLLLCLFNVQSRTGTVARFASHRSPECLNNLEPGPDLPVSLDEWFYFINLYTHSSNSCHEFTAKG